MDEPFTEEQKRCLELSSGMPLLFGIQNIIDRVAHNPDEVYDESGFKTNDKHIEYAYKGGIKKAAKTMPNLTAPDLIDTDKPCTIIKDFSVACQASPPEPTPIQKLSGFLKRIFSLSTNNESLKNAEERGFNFTRFYMVESAKRLARETLRNEVVKERMEDVAQGGNNGHTPNPA